MQHQLIEYIFAEGAQRLRNRILVEVVGLAWSTCLLTSHMDLQSESLYNLIVLLMPSIK